MRILQIHNFYQTPGGEDQVYAAEASLLKRHGNAVYQYEAHNETISSVSRVRVAIDAVWNPDTYRNIKAVIARESPDIIHAHNTFPIISPAIYDAAAAAGIPVVQTLHNYRLLCPATNLFRDGSACEKCVASAVPYKAVWNRCYRNSASATAVVASMLLTHRLAGTWKNKIHTYIALSNFAKRKLVEGGLPVNRIVVKPNFLAVDPGLGSGNGRYALFVGRLSEEKGITTLLHAWKALESKVRLIIVGDGPLAPWVRQQIQMLHSVEWLGSCVRERVFALMKEATFLIFPSQCYEGLPMTIIEALACGTPVVASAIGSMNELIIDGLNGYRFAPGESNDLIGRILSMLAQPGELHALRKSSRVCYEENYTAERNYPLLITIYRSAIESAQSRQLPGSTYLQSK